MKELPKTDQKMLSRLANRSESAWLDFVQIYEDALMRFCVSRGLSHEDSAEVCQEVLAALDKNLVNGKYDPDKGGFRNWLFRIARNISVDKFKERAKQINAGGGTSVQRLIEATAGNNDVSKAIEMEYRRSLVSMAAAKIKPDVSEKNWLCFWETAISGRAPEDVASELGMSIGSVYTAKCRMISRIRKVVASYDDQPPSAVIDKADIHNEDHDREI